MTSTINLEETENIIKKDRCLNTGAKKQMKPLQAKNTQRNQKDTTRFSGTKKVSIGATDAITKQKKLSSGALKMDNKPDVEELQTKGSDEQNLNKPENMSKPNMTQPLQIESNVTKPQDQLSMRERLELWKQEKKQKKEQELNLLKAKAKKRVPPPPVPTFTKKNETRSNMTDRRSTFNVTKVRAQIPKDVHLKRPDQTKKAPRVAVKKPVLVVGSSKQSMQKSQPLNQQAKPDMRRHSSITRRRLSAGMSKRPIGILKRKSCVPALDTDSAVGAPGETTTEKHGASTHVKFLSPKQTPVHHRDHHVFRKTPSKTKETPCKNDSMRHKLNCWLESRGTTPSKFRHLMCFDASVSEKKKMDSQTARSITIQQLSKQQKKIASEESVCKNLAAEFEAEKEAEKPVDLEKTSKVIKEQLDSLLTECHHLIETGCPTDTLLSWLSNIYENIPLARYYTPYYKCKVEAVKRHGSSGEVVDVITQAIKNSAQPASELAELNAAVMKELLTRMSSPAVVIDTALQQDVNVDVSVFGDQEESQNKNGEMGCQRRLEKRKAEEHQINEPPFPIQYYVSNVTPFKKSKRAASLSTPQTQTVVTPVRRSTRKSVTANVTDSEKVIRSISELSETEKNSALFRPNHALDNVLEKYQ